MVDIKGFQRFPEITGDDERDTALLRGMANTARKFITQFAWCPPLATIYLAHGVGDIVAVFLAEFSQRIGETDDKLWVIVGDLPSAYLVVEPEDSAAKALERYCELMEDWIAAVRDHSDLRDVYPVAAEPTTENAEMLEKRVAFLLAEIIPCMA